MMIGMFVSVEVCRCFSSVKLFIFGICRFSIIKFGCLVFIRFSVFLLWVVWVIWKFVFVLMWLIM